MGRDDSPHPETFVSGYASVRQAPPALAACTSPREGISLTAGACGQARRARVGLREDHENDHR
jgi:hypothetical protein